MVPGGTELWNSSGPIGKPALILLDYRAGIGGEVEGWRFWRWVNVVCAIVRKRVGLGSRGSLGWEKVMCKPFFPGSDSRRDCLVRCRVKFESGLFGVIAVQEVGAVCTTISKLGLSSRIRGEQHDKHTGSG